MKIEIIGEYASYKLCYISRFGSGLVWFSDCDPSLVCGDDFNDAPYEHNAGTPYDHRYDENDQSIPVDFVVICYGHHAYETPAQKAWGGNSQYSVEMINLKHTAWLAPDSYAGNVKIYPPIFAGTTLQEFLNIFLSTGGVIYFPHTFLEHVKAIVDDSSNHPGDPVISSPD